MKRSQLSRAVIAAPGVAAAIVALVGLLDGPAKERHQIAPTHRAAEPRAARPLGPGPTPLTAGAGREVGVPARLVGEGSFLTVEGRLARLSPAPTRRRVVALTFDDGPGPMTGAFVDRLERLHAKATFFVVGYAIGQRPDALRRIRAAGMAIGNHSLTHPLMRALGARRQRSQIAGMEDAIARQVGYRPLFFRPPYKSFNMVTAREIAAAGMVGVLWTVDTGDWSRPGVRTIVRRALRVKPGGVIAMHDWGGDRRQTLAALGPIVRALRRRHLEPVTLDQLYRR